MCFILLPSLEQYLKEISTFRDEHNFDDNYYSREFTSIKALLLSRPAFLLPERNGNWDIKLRMIFKGCKKEFCVYFYRNFFAEYLFLRSQEMSYLFPFFYDFMKSCLSVYNKNDEARKYIFATLLHANLVPRKKSHNLI